MPTIVRGCVWTSVLVMLSFAPTAAAQATQTATEAPTESAPTNPAQDTAPTTPTATAPATTEWSNPLVSEDPIQPNGDWERFPYAPHVPIGLSINVPFGSFAGGDNAGLSANAGTFVNFEIGVGVRARRLLIALMFAIGGAGVNGTMADVIESQGFDTSSTLHVFAGLDGAYYLARTQSLATWLGARFGYDGISFGGNQGERTHLSYSFGGIYLGARAGADWRLAPAFGIGVFADLGVGRFTSGSTTISIDDDPITLENESQEVSDDLDLDGGAFHGYIGAGLRVVFFP